MQPSWCDTAWKWNLDVIVWLSVSSVQIRLWIWMNDVADSSICSRLLVHPHLFPSPTPSAPPLSLTGLDTDTRRCRVTDSGTDSGNGRGQCMWFSHPAHNHSLCVFILVSGPQRSYCNSISGSCGSSQSGSGWYRQLVESAGNRKALYTESLLLAAAVLNSFPFTRPAVRRSCLFHATHADSRLWNFSALRRVDSHMKSWMSCVKLQYLSVMLTSSYRCQEHSEM